ncbi:MAG: hypothetical protein AABZ30_10775, partial [Myxococcota bacterium]
MSHQCPLGPRRESRAILQHVRGHLVVALERLPRVGAEGPGAEPHVLVAALGVGAEEQPVAPHDREKHLARVQAVPAEHPPRLDLAKVAELVQHEVDEAGVP